MSIGCGSRFFENADLQKLADLLHASKKWQLDFEKVEEHGGKIQKWIFLNGDKGRRANFYLVDESYSDWHYRYRETYDAFIVSFMKENDKRRVYFEARKKLLGEHSDPNE